MDDDNMRCPRCQHSWYTTLQLATEVCSLCLFRFPTGYEPKAKEKSMMIEASDVKKIVDKYLEEMGVLVALEKAKHLTTILDTVLNLIESDNHSFSSRPCQTCTAVSALVGRKFGCEKINKE